MIFFGLMLAASAQAAGSPQTSNAANAATMLRERIMENDADGDGSISRREFETMLAARGGRAQQNGGRIFERIDANGDGQIAGAELDRIVEMQAKRLDTNGDGIISEAERQAAREGRSRNRR